MPARRSAVVLQHMLSAPSSSASTAQRARESDDSRRFELGNAEFPISSGWATEGGIGRHGAVDKCSGAGSASGTLTGVTSLRVLPAGALLVLAVGCGSTPVPPPVAVPAAAVVASAPVPTDAFGVTVTRVVDGDTVIARRDGATATVRVRVLGVDSPESVKPGTPVACYGHQASAFTRMLLPAGTRMRAAYEVDHQDVYGRELWDLWFPDGRYFEAILAASGTVRPDPFPPNITYAAPIAAAVRAAHDQRRGLWGACALTRAFPQLARSTASP